MRMSKFKVIIIGFLSLFTLPLLAQNYNFDWWIAKHHWDGHIQWNHMMNTSAAYFGPNALPVPDLRDGRVSSQYRFEIRPEAQLSKGDQTYDLYTSFIAPLGKNIASFEVFLVPSEYYKLDTITRDKRLARHINAEGYCGGDFWFGTNIQIVRDKRFPDLVFSAYFKTASGTNLSDARYTDAPAYYMLLNAGKDIYQNKDNTLRLYGHLGAYIYQTWSDTNSQDDAYAYALGIKYSSPNFYLTAELSAYHGYLNNGDQPAVLRFQYALKKEHFDWRWRYQYGIHDFEYQSFSFAMIYKFDTF